MVNLFEVRLRVFVVISFASTDPTRSLVAITSPACRVPEIVTSLAITAPAFMREARRVLAATVFSRMLPEFLIW